MGADALTGRSVAIKRTATAVAPAIRQAGRIAPNAIPQNTATPTTGAIM